MTAEQYKKLLTKPEIPMDIWYEFFLEKGGSKIGLEKFTEIFTKMLLRVDIITPTGVKFVSLESALRKFYEHYNKKFKNEGD